MNRSRTSFAHLSRIATTTGAAASMMLLVSLLTACTDPEQGSLESPSETEASQKSPDDDPKFVMEIDPDACPPAGALPGEYAAPEDIGYQEDFSTPNSYETLSCSYRGGVEILDGLDSIVLASGGTDVIITDGSPLIPLFQGTAVDFNQASGAEYFQEWDQVVQDVETDSSYFMEESSAIVFNFFANLDNLYVTASFVFVVPDELVLNSGNEVAKAEVKTAAYEILGALVPPVVDGLERE
ncbi:hypothetical protein GCM10010403_25560 [Glycomyces rutgersensis]